MNRSFSDIPNYFGSESELKDAIRGQLGSRGNELGGSSSSNRASSLRGGGRGDQIPSGYREGKLRRFDKRQMDLYKQMFGHFDDDSYLSRLAEGDEDLFNEMEAPAMRQFNEMQGGLASRFSGMGMGARGSSGFQNMSTQGASNLAQDLQANRKKLQREAILDLQGLSRELLGLRPEEKFLLKKDYPQQQPEQSGDWLGGILSGLAGGAAGFASGGMTGAVGGAGTGFYKGYRGGF